MKLYKYIIVSILLLLPLIMPFQGIVIMTFVFGFISLLLLFRLNRQKMTRELVFILSLLIASGIYWAITILFRIFYIELYVTLDEYTIVGYFLLLLGFFVYYIIKIFPNIHEFVGCVVAVLLGIYTFYIVGFLAMERKTFFNEFEILVQCEQLTIYSQYKGVYKGGKGLYIKEEGSIYSDIDQYRSQIITYEFELSPQQRDCLQAAGYSVKFVDISQ